MLNGVFMLMLLTFLSTPSARRATFGGKLAYKMDC